MITAIIGPAGVGKTTITNLFSSGIIIIADEVVKAIYSSTIMNRYFLKNEVLKAAVREDESIDRDILIKLLIRNRKEKEALEDFLFDNFFKETINKARLEEKDLVIDGLPRRFISYFDRVIYIEMKEGDRIKNLLSRGLSMEKILDIISLQEDMFFDLFQENV